MLLPKDALHSASPKAHEARNATRGAIDTSHLPEDALQSAKDPVHKT